MLNKFFKLALASLAIIPCGSMLLADDATPKTLDISLTLNPSAYLTVTGGPLAFGTVNPSDTGVLSTNSATITAYSNGVTGYTITLSAANGGGVNLNLVNGSDTINYSVFLNGGSSALTNNTTIMSGDGTGGDFLQTATIAGALTLPDLSSMAAGNYEDVLTFTFAANS